MDDIEQLWKLLLADGRIAHLDLPDGFRIQGEFVPCAIATVLRQGRWQKLSRCVFEIDHPDFGRGNPQHWSENTVARFEEDRYYCFRDWFIDEGRRWLSHFRERLAMQLLELLEHGENARAVHFDIPF
jgi:hypothetical protein